MSTYRLDYETTSKCDIKLGAWPYAAHESTRILMFAITRNGEKPFLWDSLDPDGWESRAARQMLSDAVMTGETISAWNAGFETAVSHYRLIKDVLISPPRVDQWICTQARARRASIPVSLAGASEFLKLGEDKDKKGKLLIGIFSDQTKVTTLTFGKEKMKTNNPVLEPEIPWDWNLTVGGEVMTVRQAWESFKDYCRQDVVVEAAADDALKPFALTDSELDGFLFTARLNALGAPVNVTAVDHAARIIAYESEKLTKQFHSITGLMPSQTAKVLEWLKEEGYPGSDLTAATMNDLKDCKLMTMAGMEALSIRAQLSFAAVKKVTAMQKMACPDGTLKGQFIWYGASATGRWVSVGAQLQNARKSSIDNAEEVYEDICNEVDMESFNFFYSNPYECVASCIRNFIQPHQGDMVSVDFSNIESRVAAMLAEQEDLLDLYREGRDAYKELASEVFGVSVESVTKDQRFVGKVGNLSLVFQTGAKTFHETCAMWGQPIEKKIACRTVKTFREKYSMFPKTWRAYEAAAIKAINNPGQWFPANKYVSFAVTLKVPFKRLLMRLPSGRHLVYPLPEIKRTIKRHRDYETGESREWESDDITYWGQQKNSVHWGRVSTYAGSIYQNSVQATARDIMQHGCVEAQKKGHRIFSIIHDEVLAYNDHADGLAGLEKILCTGPDWLDKNFPLAASGEVCPYYTKS